MNREEAIHILDNLKPTNTKSSFDAYVVGQAITMAIKVLEQEPTTKNNLGVDCINKADFVKKLESETIGLQSWQKALIYQVMDDCHSVTPQLSVSEVTALAEWTEKLTKASEDAYNKGYEAGRKELEPITSKDKFIYALTACGCLLKDGKTWYEHNELIKCFEDLGLFEQDPFINKPCVSSGVCEHDKNKTLDKIKEEIGYLRTFNPYTVAFQQDVLNVIDKYKAESEA